MRRFAMLTSTARPAKTTRATTPPHPSITCSPSCPRRSSNSIGTSWWMRSRRVAQRCRCCLLDAHAVAWRLAHLTHWLCHSTPMHVGGSMQPGKTSCIIAWLHGCIALARGGGCTGCDQETDWLPAANVHAQKACLHPPSDQPQHCGAINKAPTKPMEQCCDAGHAPH